MAFIADHGASVILSSHLVSDLERVCDYLIVLVASRVRIAGEVDDLLATHHRVTGARRDLGSLLPLVETIEESHTDRQSTLIVRSSTPIDDPAWTGRTAHPRRPRAGLHGSGRHRTRPHRRIGDAAMIWFTWRQFRTQTWITVGALAVIAVVLAVSRPQRRRSVDRPAAPPPATATAATRSARSSTR